MMVGHYSAAFVAKALAPRAPLWTLFIAAQFVDIFWGVLVVAGVEYGRLDTSLSSNPFVLEHMPYTHSLVGTVGFSVLGFALAYALTRALAPSLAAAGAVLSHWFLDVAVHRPDMTLWGPEPRLGLRLWDFPVAALLVELALLAVAVAWCIRAAGWRGRAKPVAFTALGLGAFQVFSLVSPVPPSLPIVAAIGTVTFFGLAALAYWLERRVERSASAG